MIKIKELSYVRDQVIPRVFSQADLEFRICKAVLLDPGPDFSPAIAISRKLIIKSRQFFRQTYLDFNLELDTCTIFFWNKDLARIIFSFLCC